jgi:hypothetical protein
MNAEETFNGMTVLPEKARCELCGLRRPGLFQSHQLRCCRSSWCCVGYHTTSTSARKFWPLHLKRGDVRSSKPAIAEAMVLAERHGSALTRDSSTTKNTQDITCMFIARAFGHISGCIYHLRTPAGTSLTFLCLRERLQRSWRHRRNVLPLVCAFEQPTT